MQLQEETFDIVIVGNNVVSLATALSLANAKPTWQIALLAAADHDSRHNDEELNLFRPNDVAANRAIPLWRALERQANVSNNTFLTLTGGYLSLNNDDNQIYSDHDQLLDATEIATRFGFHSVTHGVFYPAGGFVNFTAVGLSLTKLLTERPNVTIRQNEYFIDLTSYSSNHSRLITNRGSLRARKLLLIPGTHVNNVLKKLNLNVKARHYEVPTMLYRVKTSANVQLPPWSTGTSLIGLPMARGDFIQISSAITSSSTTRSTINTWVKNHLSSVINSTGLNVSSNAFTATKLFPSSPILDRLPACSHYSNETFLHIHQSFDGRSSPNTLVWAEMLTQLVLSTSSSNSIYTDLFSAMRATGLAC